MSRFVGSPSSLKRKRPEDPPGLVDPERAILNAIKSKKGLGIWKGDIRQETKLMDHVVTKYLKTLLQKKLIKEVVNIQKKGQKHYMAIEFEPSKEISGGDWYVDGNLDKELINVLKRLCLLYMKDPKVKVATVEGVRNYLNKKGVVQFEVSTQQVGELLNSMVLGNEIIEVKSTGYGDYYGIRVGDPCYRLDTRVGAGKGPRLGSFAFIPCGACPRISMCTAGGVISPATCVYYTKWLDIEF